MSNARFAELRDVTVNGRPYAKYVLVMSCGFFEGMYDFSSGNFGDLKVPSSEDGSLTQRAVCLALDLVHLDVAVQSLDEDALLDVHVALDFLDGPQETRNSVIAAAWQAMRSRFIARDDTPADGQRVQRYLASYFRCDKIRYDVLRVLTARFPLFRDLRRVIVRPEYDAATVRWLVARLVRFYPIGTLFRAFSSCVSDPVGLLLDASVGPHWHPAELIDIVAGLPREDLPPLVQTIIAGLTQYDVVPRGRLHGSVLGFSDASFASACVEVSGSVQRRAVCPWLRLSYQQSTGAIEAWVRPAKIDDDSKHTTVVELRIVAESALGEAEAWWFWSPPIFAPPATAATELHTGDAGDSVETLGLVPRGQRLRLRCDVFYNTSAYARPPV